MILTEEALGQLVEYIWASILGVEPLPVSPPETSGTGNEYLTGCVQITGEWVGAVTLNCPEGLARMASSIMLEADQENITVDEVQDALGELTNIIAGNLKSLLPGSNHLSMPAVVDGRDYRLIVPGSRLVHQVFYECNGFPFLIALLEQDDAERPGNANKGRESS
jgi:chemotaxis protein CheX